MARATKSTSNEPQLTALVSMGLAMRLSATKIEWEAAQARADAALRSAMAAVEAGLPVPAGAKAVLDADACGVALRAHAAYEEARATIAVRDMRAGTATPESAWRALSDFHNATVNVTGATPKAKATFAALSKRLATVAQVEAIYDLALAAYAAHG